MGAQTTPHISGGLRPGEEMLSLLMDQLCLQAFLGDEADESRNAESSVAGRLVDVILRLRSSGRLWRQLSGEHELSCIHLPELHPWHIFKKQTKSKI